MDKAQPIPSTQLSPVTRKYAADNAQQVAKRNACGSEGLPLRVSCSAQHTQAAKFLPIFLKQLLLQVRHQIRVVMLCARILQQHFLSCILYLAHLCSHAADSVLQFTGSRVGLEPTRSTPPHTTPC